MARLALGKDSKIALKLRCIPPGEGRDAAELQRGIILEDIQRCALLGLERLQGRQADAEVYARAAWMELWMLYRPY